jgi:hypothetical protein
MKTVILKSYSNFERPHIQNNEKVKILKELQLEKLLISLFWHLDSEKCNFEILKFLQSIVIINLEKIKFIYMILGHYFVGIPTLKP